MLSEIQTKNKIEANKGIKVSPFRKDIRKTSPHKHNSYFEIIYLSVGSGFHSIDTQRYEVKPPVVFFVRKEQVHHWELDGEPDGYVLIIRKSFMEKSLDIELKTLLAKLSSQSSLRIPENTSVDLLFRLLIAENTEADDHASKVVEGLLKALLAKILSVAQPIVKLAKPKADTYHTYRELLGQDKRIRNNVAHYAELLNTTPQNLNAACRKAANLSASELLAEYVVSEAKRLLLYTDNTVAEISFALSFKDSSHFIKYFKRFTGYTPQVFRNQQD